MDADKYERLAVNAMQPVAQTELAGGGNDLAVAQIYALLALVAEVRELKDEVARIRRKI